MAMAVARRERRCGRLSESSGSWNSMPDWPRFLPGTCRGSCAMASSTACRVLSRSSRTACCNHRAADRGRPDRRNLCHAQSREAPPSRRSRDSLIGCGSSADPRSAIFHKETRQCRMFASPSFITAAMATPHGRLRPWAGVEQVPDATVLLLNVDEAQTRWADTEADAIVFGAPTYVAGVSAAFKAFQEASSRLVMTQGFGGKIRWAGFTNSGSRSGDKLATLIQLALFAAQHGMHWVVSRYPRPIIRRSDRKQT